LCLVTKDWPSHTISLPEKFSSLDIIAVTICTYVGPIRYITAYRPPEFNKLGRENMVLFRVRVGRERMGTPFPFFFRLDA